MNHEHPSSAETEVIQLDAEDSPSKLGKKERFKAFMKKDRTLSKNGWAALLIFQLAVVSFFAYQLATESADREVATIQQMQEVEKQLNEKKLATEAAEKELAAIQQTVGEQREAAQKTEGFVK